MNNFLLIDKPKGMTSHDVVDFVRQITNEKRVGHAGTLDPNASGLLIVGVGRKETKKLGEVAKNTSKTYEAEIILGESRETDDIEGKVISRSDTKPSLQEIKDVLKSFIGQQEQTPPSFSAIKLQGKKAYELARKGKKVFLSPRQVTVYSLELVDYSYPFLKLICEVSSGTYIRSLARDIGEKLGSFGFLNNLRRTRIGEFDIKDSKSLAEIEKLQWQSQPKNQ